MNFFNFFDWDQKYKCLRHHFQYLAQLIAPRGGSGAIQIFSIHDYGTFFAVVSTTRGGWATRANRAKPGAPPLFCAAVSS